MSLQGTWVSGVWRSVVVVCLLGSYPASAVHAQGPCPHGNIVSPSRSGTWTEDIWGLDGGYPDNDGGVDAHSGLCVLLGGVEILLDEDISIDGLELLTGSRLRVAQETNGNLLVENGGGIVTSGDVEVAWNRVITVDQGTGVTIGYAGTYIADRLTPGNLPNTALLQAETVTLLPTVPGALDQMTLSHTMQTVVAGDFVMDGTMWNDCPDCVCLPPQRLDKVGESRGGKTPPILKGLTQSRLKHIFDYIGPSPEMVVHGAFRIFCAAEIMLACRDMAVAVAGDFDNQSRWPHFFHWEAGQLYLNGTAPQIFEVGGIDINQLPDPADVTGNGFNLQGRPLHDPGPHSNFSMGTVWVDGDSHVTFVNDVENTVGTGACQEALYVDQLYLAEGATIVLDDVRIYYAFQAGHKANIITLGCGEMVRVPRPFLPGRCPTIPTVSQWGLVVMTLLLVTAGSIVVLRRRAAATA